MKPAEDSPSFVPPRDPATIELPPHEPAGTPHHTDPAPPLPAPARSLRSAA